MSKIKRTKADADFSRLIRTRDDWTCQRCHKRHPEKSVGLHSAHMFTRRTGVTRFDEENAMALCYGCHQYADSHPAEKEALFRARLGDERFDALAARSHARRDRTTA